MTANPVLLQKKYSRVIECFAKQQGISLDVALDFFYHSQVYQLIRDGVSDMHCIVICIWQRNWNKNMSKEATRESAMPLSQLFDKVFGK